jgi:hypothetical protein
MHATLGFAITRSGKIERSQLKAYTQKKGANNNAAATGAKKSRTKQMRAILQDARA